MADQPDESTLASLQSEDHQKRMHYSHLLMEIGRALKIPLASEDDAAIVMKAVKTLTVEHELLKRFIESVEEEMKITEPITQTDFLARIQNMAHAEWYVNTFVYQLLEKLKQSSGDREGTILARVDDLLSFETEHERLQNWIEGIAAKLGKPPVDWEGPEAYIEDRLERLLALEAAMNPVKGCIYLSGPMTGYPDNNAAAFHAETSRLRALGYPVINPAETDGAEMKEWEEYLRNDIITMLSGATRLALLPGWGDSQGAQLEVDVAKRLNMSCVMSATITERFDG